MQTHAARDALPFIRRVLDGTERRIDPHAFHCVAWCAIVLVERTPTAWSASPGAAPGPG